MADTGNEHYQPWLRNRGDGDAVPAASAPSTDAPPIRDVSRLSADDLLARPAPLPTQVDAPRFADRVSSGWARFADWTIRTGEAWDVPGRIARWRLGERANAVIERGGAAARSAGSSASGMAGRAAEAAAPKLRAAGESVRDGLSKGANAAKSGLAHGAGAVGDGMKGAARKAATSAQTRVGGLMPATAAELAPPQSELERLIARDGLAPDAAPVARPTANGLPLFSETPAVAISPAPLATNAMPAAVAPAQSAPLAAPTATPPAATTVPPEVRAGADTSGGWRQHPATWGLSALALFLVGALVGQWWQGGRVTPEAVRAALLAQPDMLPAAMDRLRSNTASASINRLRSRIETPFSGAWAGNADGDVVLTVFTDYACTFCRASEADIERLLREDRNLKVVFRELPIISPDSEAAARLALVAARAGRYMPFHSAMFAAGPPARATRIATATRTGVSTDAAAMGDPAITREIESNLEIARTLGVDGTPAWIVGDRMLSGAQGIAVLRQAISEARAAR
jgi:predicted DsbA family dithiol-disulfide isomerase